MISLHQHAGTAAAVPNQQTDVELDAQLRLRNSGYRALRGLVCEFHDGVLTLRGKVATFHLKQVAQTLVRSVAKVTRVDNRVSVEH